MVNRRDYGAPPRHRDVHNEEEVLRIFENNPGSSVRRVAHALGISRTTVHRIIRQNGLHPYHYQRVQQLLPRDAEQRICFCQGLLAQYRQDVTFPDRILWTDEATFTLNGVFNSRNFLLWQEENPHAIREGIFQYRWSINVWAGVTADRVIGPYFLPPRLNGQAYGHFLRNDLPILLEDVPLHMRQILVFQHDGAPAHSARQIRHILNTRFPERWMGRGGPITWPARSPDLNVLDYFVWGYVKASVEHRRDGNEDEVREAIVAAFNTITPDMAHRATQQIIRRAELCLQAEGSHFEQLLP
ncbi:uncharacterized protein LOC116852618 [Odontomachus brunneus]|uniref:uncharacterized protein LOC116852618 n=1 Tax=Odontomachus brunneus TaxID=486640 RepID=UPI0013F222D8|nr:uncharacterized protein LOC116852618 [Odontomachus brunneus]